MIPSKRINQNWLPSIFNEIFEDDLNFGHNAKSPAINIIEKENELSGETKVFITSGIVFICSMILLGIGMLF